MARNRQVNPADFTFPVGGNAYAYGEDGMVQTIIINSPRTNQTWEWRPNKEELWTWVTHDQTTFCRERGLPPLTEDEVLEALGQGLRDLDIGPDDGA